MTTNTYYHEEEWEVDQWISFYDQASHFEESSPPLPFDIVALAAAILVCLGLILGVGYIIKDTDKIDIITSTSFQKTEKSEDKIPQPVAPISNSPTAISAPYGQYIITQGIHGQSYGHMAIDIAAGKGEPIKSPIDGIVSNYFIDGIGNPTLVIENDYYQVTMLHGNFSVEIGDVLTMGDQVGTEGNLGNTRDMQGRSCRNRDCGYHTHLNVFDKQANSNINPLDVISQ